MIMNVMIDHDHHYKSHGILWKLTTKITMKSSAPLCSAAAPLQALRLWQQRRPCQARQVFQGLRPKGLVFGRGNPTKSMAFE
jgi:hypothetical protein